MLGPVHRAQSPVLPSTPAKKPRDYRRSTEYPRSTSGKSTNDIRVPRRELANHHIRDDVVHVAPSSRKSANHNLTRFSSRPFLRHNAHIVCPTFNRSNPSAKSRNFCATPRTNKEKQERDTNPLTPSFANVFLTTSIAPVYVPGGAVCRRTFVRSNGWPDAWVIGSVSWVGKK